MSEHRNWTVTVADGTRLVYDGELYTVAGLDADSVLLRGQGGRSMRIRTATLLADPATRILGAREDPPTPAGPVLGDLDNADLGELDRRLGHVREVLTGYVSGYAETAVVGEPRPAYAPSVPLLDRYAAKAAELGIGRRTLQRWVAAFGESGPAGLVDGRSTRTANVLSGVDERWLAMCRIVVDEHTEASRPTKNLLLARVAARLEAEYGTVTVTPPGVKKARMVLTELTRGTNTFTGSTKGKRSIANRPDGVYGRLRATRPGEYLLLDTTPLDVFAMEPLTLRWVRVELTVAMDLYSRAIVGLRLSPVSTKAVDAAIVLFETLRPESRQSTGAGLLPYAGLPDIVVVDAEQAQFGASAVSMRSPVSQAGLPEVAAETVVVDHGKIYLSRHVMSVCERLGISIQPARPLTPTDKAAVERFFRTLREGLLAALPGYKGPDIHSRGVDPEGCTYFFVDELEQVIREWISIYHHRPHRGLVAPQVPGLDLSPAEMFDAGLARAGRLRIPTHPGLVFDFLPTSWRTVQHYGVEIHGLRYNGPALGGCRNRTSPFTGAHAGKWPVRYDPDDASKIYFCDPDDREQVWHELAWEHAEDIGTPFSAETLAYARRLALASGRHVDARRALAELLDRWDAGLVRHPAERRMAIRACQQRQSRLDAATTGDATAQIAALPTVAAITAADDTTTPMRAAQASPAGDDDSAEELDIDSEADEVDADLTDEEFYADALGVLP
ncbi:Mu transposase C-terminal domain-containing protein [Amycolatopsis sp. H20-H5]|uniref:Mu transposase C-terminal domain-containing protein n=1 Tax=Amycolatopsis sp. H20-H5 TaxID=3046309 RepID=UPI002DB92C67|nr:Mu transposase C-terminal domain-containing protein [Amycolatopsis sp. H20-H5]MEC3974929.1 Mu transposase C-terminal domain-containing protein [Amycolatopsis sp. H20-H5]